MNTFQRASATVIVGFLGLTSAESHGQQVIDLYILAGQSNAVGQGVLSGMTAGPTGPVDDHLIWNPSTGQMEVLAPGVNNLGNQHGIELTLLWRSQWHSQGPVALVKVAANGSSMLDPNPIGDLGVWDVDSEDLYSDLVQSTLEARTQLESMGYSVNTRALIWWQGESDACVCGNGVDGYYDNTSQLFTSYRFDIGEQNLPIYVIKIGNNIGSWISQFGNVNVIRALQDELEDIPNVHVLNVDQWYSGDIHPNGAALAAIGVFVADNIHLEITTGIADQRLQQAFLDEYNLPFDILGRRIAAGDRPYTLMANSGRFFIVVSE